MLSRNERCAEELIDRVRFILNKLPECMRPKLSANSRQEIAFKHLGSRILSIPATPDGPRMYSPTGVFWDEMAFTPYDRQIWSALQPALMSGGRFVGVSSSGGARNFFADMAAEKSSDKEYPPVHGGTTGGSLFHIHRVHYSRHPERASDKWKQTAGAGLSQLQWEKEQEISFEATEDLIYSEFDPIQHILREDWVVNPEWGIYRTIDFGYRHPFVLWLQRTPSDEYIVFEEWAGTNATTEQMAQDIRRIELSHGIRESDVSWTACDPAGAAMQDSGLSPVDALNSHGFRLRYRSSRILPGVEQVKAALLDVRGRVSLRIAPRCRRLIADLSRYRWSPGREEPVKDGQCDHSMDALRYFFVNLNSTEDSFPVRPRLA